MGKDFPGQSKEELNSAEPIDQKGQISLNLFLS